jgi:rare lipoprotein A
MNKRLLWTIAALLTTALGMPLSSNAETKEVNPLRKQATPPYVPTEPTNVVKVGEYQSPTGNQADRIVARIQPHQLAGHPAATLYVRNIPVLTFVSSKPVATSSTMGTNKDSRSATRSAQTKVATIENLANLNRQASFGHDYDIQATNTPLWRATAMAAKLNQLSLDNVDASTITVSWKAGGGAATKTLGDRYLIKVNGEELVEINAATRLPDQTNDLGIDALQATNRLRRLLGNAPPLREVSGKPAPPPKQQQQKPRPKLPQQISLGLVRIRLSGMASWYGPGFHGNRSASGERYNQNALTAAHRSLPFGTKVRVINTRNGRSVVVRINDRGPHIRGRIIDLSAAAARIVGVMQSGVAPVRVEVMR